jgi:hypothetical protein
VTVGEGRAAAARWVAAHAAGTADYRGAFFTGSTVGVPDAAPLPPTSDVDVVLVTAEEVAPPKIGKFRHGGVLLEVSHIAEREVADPERVLADYPLAPSFAAGAVLDDPTGRLRALSAWVAERFAHRSWVERRCDHARRRIESRLAALTDAALTGPREGGAPEPDFAAALTGWLFATGVTTHVLLVAALRNPTVRLRYPAVREVLSGYGFGGEYPGLLALLGCEDLPAEVARRHLGTVEAAFEAAARVARTAFPFSADLTAEARAVAVEGSRELVGRGEQREAVFWMVATLARCQTVLRADAPAAAREWEPAFRAAVAELTGVAGPADLPGRAARTAGAVPGVMRLAGRILDANPGVVQGR